MFYYSLLVRLFLGISLCCATNRRWWFYPARQLNVNGAVCVEFTDHQCNEVFNRSAADTYAKFPNSRGLGLHSARAEFSQYSLLFREQPRGCYREMWSLLCFHYFPQCRPNLPVKYIVTPCRELCERAQTGCESFIRSKNFTWPEHLRCTNFNSSTTDHLCINSPAPSQTVPSYQPPSAPSPTSTSVVLITPTTILSPSPTLSATFSSLPVSSSLSPTPVQCYSRCKVRNKATSNTYKRNNYTFAANVTIISVNRDQSHIFLAVVTRSWTLDNTTCAQFQDRVHMIIRTSSARCQPPCPNFNTTTGHNVYLVSGYCNDRGWYLPTTDSLVSPWFKYPKYETRLDTWIRNGIECRRNGCM